MVRSKSVALVINLFFTLPFTDGATSILYEYNDSLDGNTCKDSDIAFCKKLINKKSACLFECATRSDCKSVFHVDNSGDCTGCTVIYDASNQPTELSDGSKYYRKPGCPDGWSMFENSCYFITEEKVNFYEGVNKCQSYKAQAAIIDNEDENNFLKTFIMSHMTSSDIAFYNGFTDSDVEGTWTAHGTTNKMMFYDWAISEPNGFENENCLTFYVPSDLRWVDITCSFLTKMICEKEI